MILTEELYDDYFSNKTKPLSEQSKNQYKAVLKKYIGKSIKYEDTKNDFIKVKQSTEKSYLTKLASISKHLSIKHPILVEECKLYKQRMDEIERKIVPNKLSKDKRELNLDDLKQKVDGISSLNVKVILTLLLHYDSLRTDIATIKWNNYDSKKDNYYSNGVIMYKTFTKQAHAPIKIDIQKEHANLIEAHIKARTDGTSRQKDVDFLFHLNCKMEDRSNGLSKLIPELTKQYFEVRLTLTDLRKLTINKATKDAIEESETVTELFDKMSTQATNNNHSLPTAMKYYISDDIELKKKSSASNNNSLLFSEISIKLGEKTLILKAENIISIEFV